MARASRGVQSVEISGRILAAMADDTQPLMLRDIANAIDVPAGQTHPYLASLRKLGLVEQDNQAGRYRLGPFALRLALARIQGREPFRGVWAALPAIADDIGFGMTMTVWCHLGPIILRTAEVPFQPFTNLRSGSLYSVTDTATGRLFAAFTPNVDVETVIKRQLATLPAPLLKPFDRDSYFASLEPVRAAGYAVTSGKPAPGISAISVPIFDRTKKMVAAITAIGPIDALDIGADGTLLETLARIARDLSEQEA